MSDATMLVELAHTDPLRRRAALERLLSAGGPLDDAAISGVVSCLGTPLKAVQCAAADLLGQVGAGQRAAVAARLRAALCDDDPRLRWGATYALGRLGIVEPAMVPSLLEALGRQDGDERWAAAALMTSCARVDADAVIPRLLAAAGGAGAELRKMSLYVLRDVAPANPAVRDVTIRSLRDPEVGVRFAALSALSRLEPVPAEACELVLALLRDDPDVGLRRAAMSALGRVGRGVSAASVVLEAGATSDDPGLRRAARAARRRLEM